MTIVETRAITGGVDTHADVHVAAALDPIGGLLGVQEFPATPAGYGQLLGWLGGFGTVCLAGIEGTGSYGAGLARHVSRAGVRVVEVDRSDWQDRRRQYRGARRDSDRNNSRIDSAGHCSLRSPAVCPAWRGVPAPQLGQDPGHVGSDRSLAERQFRSDLVGCASQLFWLATIFVRYSGRVGSGGPDCSAGPQRAPRSAAVLGIGQ